MMKQTKIWKLVCIFILALGVLFRVADPGHKFYWEDEVRTSLRTSGYLPHHVVEEVYNGEILTLQDLERFKFPSAERDLKDATYALMTHPEHVPLYYLAHRFWAQWFGSSVTAVRSLAVIISLLAFPCLYWLGKELFASERATWFAIAIVAVSPLHVLYAQEAREYSIWTTTIILASAALLRALRVNTWRSWLVYILTAILGFYSHFLFALVAFVHTIYVVGMEKFRPSQRVFRFFKSMVLAGLAFVPWILVAIAHGHQMDRVVSAISKPIPFNRLVDIWFRSLNRVFFSADLGGANIIIVAVCLYVVFAVWRSAPRRISLFLISFIAVNALAIMGQDIILGGSRSSRLRYLTPAYLGIQLTAAYFFAQQFEVVKSWRQRAWQVFAVVAISISIIGCGVDLNKQVTWNKGDDNAKRYLEAAYAINISPRPLVISDALPIPKEPDAVHLINLSYNLDPDVRFLLVKRPNVPEIPAGFSSIYLFKPSVNLVEQLSADPNVQLELIIAEESFPVWQVFVNRPEILPRN